MPCEDPEEPWIAPDQPITDWAKITSYVAKRVYSPAHSDGHPALPRLVRAIRHGEASGGGMKAAGSNYSFSGAQIPDRHRYLIATDWFNRHLSRPFPDPPGSLAADRYASAEHDRRWLEHVARIQPGEDRFLIHVEAGIKIKQLLTDLDALGLGLPTMGAGGGQSLAGALSTGTHGADVRLRPLGDFVRAVHLVGPAGQEWWIEPADGFTHAPRVVAIPGWCPETFVVRNDDWFRAALVAVGRFGVIYSMVLEVTRNYRLHETTNLEPGDELSWGHVLPRLDWPDVRAALRDSADGDYFAGGVLDAPSHENRALRFYQVVVEIGLGECCWVTRRWRTTNGENKNLDGSSASTNHFLCADSGAFFPILELLHGVIIGLAGQVGSIPFIGIYWSVQVTTFYWELVAALDWADTVADFLVRAIALMSKLNETDYGFAASILKAIVKDLNGTILHNAQTSMRQGGSHAILDTHNYDQDGCMSADSAEYFFDASEKRYLGFVADVLNAAQDLGPVPGYVAMRFMQGSQALLAMQRWPLTVSIEVAAPRSHAGHDGPDYNAFHAKVHEIATNFDGVPHWGQQHVLTAERVEELYGEALDTWRWVLAELEGHDQLVTFRSERTVIWGLEAVRTLDEHRSTRWGGVFVADLVPLLL